MRTTGALPTECPACAGFGYNDKCAPEMRLVLNEEMGAYVEVETIKQGSGCLRCGGTGQLEK